VHPAGCDGNGGSSSSGAELPWDALFHNVMGDTRKVAAGEELPLTGVGEDTDRRLSSIFVEPFDMQVRFQKPSVKQAAPGIKCEQAASPNPCMRGMHAKLSPPTVTLHC
jgi:hypothetical protein